MKPPKVPHCTWNQILKFRFAKSNRSWSFPPSVTHLAPSSHFISTHIPGFPNSTSLFPLGRVPALRSPYPCPNSHFCRASSLSGVLKANAISREAFVSQSIVATGSFSVTLPDVIFLQFLLLSDYHSGLDTYLFVVYTHTHKCTHQLWYPQER